MILQISSPELTSLVKEKTGKDINFHIVDDHTINVGYNIIQKVMFLGNVSKNVNLDIVIEKIMNTDLYLRYSTKVFGGDALVGILISALPLFANGDIVKKDNKGEIIVHLDKIEKIKDLINKVNLDSIYFNSDNILIDFSLK